MAVRCKYTCQSITTRQAWRQTGEKPYIYEAEFQAVMDGSPENKSFFDATPTGSLKVGMYKNDVFQVGKSYYLNIEEAPATPPVTNG